MSDLYEGEPTDTLDTLEARMNELYRALVVVEGADPAPMAAISNLKTRLRELSQAALTIRSAACMHTEALSWAKPDWVEICCHECGLAFDAKGPEAHKGQQTAPPTS